MTYKICFATMINLLSVSWTNFHKSFLIKKSLFDANAAGNSEKVMQHCFRPYDPNCQTLKYVIWFKFPLLTWIAVYLQYDTRIQLKLITAHRKTAPNKKNLSWPKKTIPNVTQWRIIREYGWRWPVGQHINNNVSDLTLKCSPNIPVNSFPRNEKDCVFQSFTS